MKNDTMDHAYAAVDLSDFSRQDISSLSSDDLPTITLDDLSYDTITLGNLAPPTFDYGSYIYPNGVTSVSIAGSGSSSGIYSSPTITLSPNTYTNGSWNSSPLTVHDGTKGITVKGDTEIEGNLKVNGVDLGEMLSKIQDQLAIYQPAPELEEKWEQLRDLARQYKELVADIKEKEKIWEILQK
jgi:hypothetical protein